MASGERPLVRKSGALALTKDSEGPMSTIGIGKTANHKYDKDKKRRTYYAIKDDE